VTDQFRICISGMDSDADDFEIVDIAHGHDPAVSVSRKVG
jgi:hypothetical protein